MTIARREIIADGEVGAYHCMARCVRRAYLCGKDALTGKSYDHRKEWIRSRLEMLAGVFAVDIGSYAIMDNHLHVIVRVRPDLARIWSAQRVTTAWRSLFGKQPATREERNRFALRIEVEAADKKLVAVRRARLSNVSWFMKVLVEPIARRANMEDGCKGRFWEGRFRCQALLDDAAMLVCSAYVDLNPIRAGVAKSPENSRFTSAFERIAQRQSQTKSCLHAKDAWLSPLDAESIPKKLSVPKRVKRPAKLQKSGGSRRASDDPWLSLSLQAYVELLDWSGRQIKNGKQGAIPKELAPILDRLKVQPDAWIGTIRNFGRMFKNAAGSVEKMSLRAKQVRRSWFHGVSHCQSIFT